jgi:2,3-bisphosphoglycerate-independent phosphoglycerate mutase
MSKKPTVLMILDGYGLNDKTEGNAIKLAKRPVMDKIMAEYPWEKGYASGLAVGLPDGQMGNSEVGHLNMGAGRIIYQELTRITKEIQDGDFFQNEALKQAMENCKVNNSDLHLFGLLSDGGVHSHITHVYGLLEMAKREGIQNVYVHAFLDGRDTPPTSGKGYVIALEEKMQELGVGKVASVMGRYYAMDRDNRWDRVEKAYRALANGEGVEAVSAPEAIQASYDKEVNDEFVVPAVVTENGKPVAVIKEKDSVIFFNFRPDRAREITRAFCDDEFTGFVRAKGRMELTYVCFTDYDVTIGHKLVAFHKVGINHTFGEFLAENNLKQLRIAETEKYAHVTFFFNGGVEVPNEGEERILVSSPKVATYDLQPEMSAYTVAEKLVEAIESLKYDVIIVNFANPDMVGHTGIVEAAVKAVEAIDDCVGKVYDALIKVNGQMFICADHGNVEQLIDYETGEPFTAHTTNPVPFILVNYDKEYGLKEGGCLADIAPTLIEMMGMTKPVEMTGKSLLIKK